MVIYYTVWLTDGHASLRIECRNAANCTASSLSLSPVCLHMDQWYLYRECQNRSFHYFFFVMTKQVNLKSIISFRIFFFSNYSSIPFNRCDLSKNTLAVISFEKKNRFIVSTESKIRCLLSIATMANDARFPFETKQKKTFGRKKSHNTIQMQSTKKQVITCSASLAFFHFTSLVWSSLLWAVNWLNYN